MNPLLVPAELIYPAIALGLVLSLAFSEIFGLAAGGLIVPGYIALELHHPGRVLGTLLVALATLIVVRVLGRAVFLYGRRRFVVTVLVGFVAGWFADRWLIFPVPAGAGVASRYIGTVVDAAAIGFVIPGLVANWMERQGVVATTSLLLIGAVIVRLALQIVSGGVILP